MRITELLLHNKATRDGSLSPRQQQELGALQHRMDSYVDKILDPNTSARGREFLKSKLRDDYAAFREQVSCLDDLAEGWQKTATSDKRSKGVPKNPRSGMLTCDKCKKAFSRLGITRHRCVPVKEAEEPVQYEVYDKKTGQTVKGRGPYSSRPRARRAVDQLDNAYGAYRYGYRPIQKSPISEAVHRLPLTTDDFDAVKRLMEKPIPAAVAPIYISEIIEDDEFNDQLLSLEDTNPNLDVRPLIVEWFKRVMPDQMYRFIPDNVTDSQRKGLMSPIHGYDPEEYHGTNDPITGDAFGRF